MNKVVKFLLTAVGIILALVIAFYLLGIVFKLLKFVIIIAIVGAILYGVYKLFNRTNRK